MDVFPIVPADVRMGWVVALTALAAVVCIGVCWLLFTSLRAATAAQFVVSPTGLAIKSDVFGRTIPLDKLKLKEARPADMRTEQALRLKWRLGGTAIRGFNSGWYKLASGEKALVYVTDPTRVAYVPTTEGYSVLLSVEDPARLIESLRRHAGAAAKR
jgi:hypothetical protein